MKKKIKGSIGVKTFLIMFTLLILCCVIIYSMVMICLPKNYHMELENQFTADYYALVEKLEKNGWESSSQDILTFSMRNNAIVQIEDESGDKVFAVNTDNNENRDGDVKTLTNSGKFGYKNRTYNIMATATLLAVSQSYDILVRLIPLIAIMIVVISAIAAYICSRYFSKPLVNICSVAKRMTSLDMTWKCDVTRNDEIGQLAVSLNEMSEQLSQALDSLQTANEQLQSDIDKERRQEQLRIDFFTSVSH